MTQSEEALTKEVIKRYESGEYLIPNVKAIVLNPEGLESSDVPQGFKDLYSMLREKQSSLKDRLAEHLSEEVKGVIDAMVELGIVFENPRDFLVAVFKEAVEHEMERFDKFMKEQQEE